MQPQQPVAGAWMLEYMCDLEAGVCYDIVDPNTGLPIKANSPFPQ